MQIPRIKIMEDDIVAATDAFILTFFVNESHEILVNRIEQVLGMYLDMVGMDALPYMLDDDGEVEDIKAKGVKELQYEVFHASLEMDTSVIRLVGAIDDQTGYGFKYVADHLPDPQYPSLRNLVSLWLPTQLCERIGWEAVCEFSCSVSKILPFSYGYGSPCLAYNDIKYALGPAKRYPGFDIAAGIACRVDIGEKVLGVYWLNFFGEFLCQELGGKERFFANLTNPIRCEVIGGNRIFVRLGDEPQVGDVNRQIAMPHYRQLAEFIQSKLHIPGNVYFPDDNGVRDEEAMIAWHRRYL